MSIREAIDHAVEVTSRPTLRVKKRLQERKGKHRAKTGLPYWWNTCSGTEGSTS